MTISSKENLLPCHNLGTFNSFGLHCQEEGMIIFAGEYNTAQDPAPVKISDVYIFYPGNKKGKIKNLGKGSRVRFGPKQSDNSWY